MTVLGRGTPSYVWLEGGGVRWALGAMVLWRCRYDGTGLIDCDTVVVEIIHSGPGRPSVIVDISGLSAAPGSATTPPGSTSPGGGSLGQQLRTDQSGLRWP